MDAIICGSLEQVSINSFYPIKSNLHLPAVSDGQRQNSHILTLTANEGTGVDKLNAKAKTVVGNENSNESCSVEKIILISCK